MFLATQYLQATIALVQLVLADLVNALPAAIFNTTSTVRLYKAGPTPTLLSVLGDFTLSTFTGYANVTLAAVLGPIGLPGGQGMHVQCDFLASGPTAPAENALGMMIVAADGVTLLAAEQFATPVPFEFAADALSYDLILAPKSRWGGEVSAA